MAIDIQERLRAMEEIGSVQGLTDLAQDRIEQVPRVWADSVRAGVSYFRVPDQRMPRGRIALLQNGANATERVMYRGYQMLQQYRSYRGANHPADWQMTDPYLAIVQRGGLHEFDAEQIIDLQWQYRPGRTAPASHRLIWEKIDALIAGGASEAEAVYAVLPQIEGHDLTRHACETCPGRLFRDAENVRHHRAVMHKADVQTLGTRDAIAQALQAGGSDMGQLIGALTALVEQLAAQQAEASPRRR